MSTTTNAVVPVVTQVQNAMKREDRAQMLDTLLAGSGITPDRFMAVVLNALVRTPDLQRASMESILDAIRVAATLRLEPTGILGEGYIVRYKDTAQFESGYRGLMKLARRSGQVDAMDSQVVYDADEFQVDLGTEPRILHRPSITGERGNFRGAYAYARLSNGELVIDWMPTPDIEAVRRVSRNSSGDHSPWVNHYGEMARKTVIKRLMKRLPLGTDGELALHHEAELDAQDQPARTPSPQVTDIRKRLGIAPAGQTSDVGHPDASGDNVVEVTDEERAALSDLTDIADAVFEGDVLTAMPIEVSATLSARCGDQFGQSEVTCDLAAGHKAKHRDDSGLVSW